MKKQILVALLFVAVGASAQQDTLKYRISLRDKAATTYSLDRPEEFLSEKSIQRRQKQGLSVDSTDLPVCRKYVDAIRKEGVNIVMTGKWDNFVTVSCNDSTLIDDIARLPFVLSTEKVWMAPDLSAAPVSVKRDSLKNEPVRTDSIYGPAARQIEMSNGHLLHEAGFKGQGMTIAVIDVGFHNADRITAMENIHILGTKDFVRPETTDIYAEGNHGMKVLSCMGMNQPYVMIGTAPEASYWLLRSEDDLSEHLVEQDYWAAALEFADSVGVDVVNTSLGYHQFDDSTKNYRYRDLNGRFALMSRQAARSADKGMILVCSAGNTGTGTWKKITPGDAENVLTVGAVDKEGVLAVFSAVGNTADGRVKPDVMALGRKAFVMGTDGTVGTANGTSFSSPIMCGMVACLWQGLPQPSGNQIPNIELVRSSGDRADCPDNIYGYGIPDMWKAYQSAR